MVQGTNTIGDKISLFKESLLQLEEVSSVSIGDYLPITGGQRYGDSFWEKGKESTEAGVNAQIWQVDPDYIQTLGMRLLAGRNFKKDFTSDSTAIIISKSLSNKLALKTNTGAILTNKNKTWKVIGIIDDFHFESLKTSISPTCLVLGHSPSTITVKLRKSDMGQVISTIQNIWHKFSPTTPFRYTFMDESFAAMHKDVKRSANLFNVFAVMTIIIACLGLLGLTTFMLELRHKEIGIRKVLGATVGNILHLISKDFLKLVIIATIFAIPIGWFIMHQWLESFAYRINIQWWMFLFAAGVTLTIAMITIGFNGIKSAIANPIEAIRTN